MPRSSTKRSRLGFQPENKQIANAIPAIYLLRMCLHFGWFRLLRSSFGLNHLMLDEGFLALTGIDLPMTKDEDGDVVFDQAKLAKWGERRWRRLLQKRLEELERIELPPDLPLLRSVEVLGQCMSLGEADRAVLRFALVSSNFSGFRDFLNNTGGFETAELLAQAIAVATNAPRDGVLQALHPEAPLRITGILELESRDFLGNGYRLGLLSRLNEVLMRYGIEEGDIIGIFLVPTTEARLRLDDFPHLAQVARWLCDYLRAAIDRRLPGVNVLLHGPPGTGKTEFCKALAHELGVKLYEVAYEDQDGDPLIGGKRMGAYNACQRILSGMPGSLLLFDEADEAFPPPDDMPMRVFGQVRRRPLPGKAWVNRLLENNSTPALWVSNHAEIDPAFLRRFSDSLHFPVPPLPVRARIVRRHLGDLVSDDAWVNRIAACDSLSPAQLEQAARLAHAVDGQPPDETRAIVEGALVRSARLFGQTLPPREADPQGYDLRFLNTDVDPARLVEALRRRARGTFCFYGPSGTGKSAFGRHLARELGLPLVVRRASDLLNMYVGETEKNIAAMFEEADRQRAVLLLDEADGFLYDRRLAERSWELTRTNEFLTRMESFDGIFICTTNLMERLDPATLRRFDFKVRFDYLRPDQREAMFLAFLRSAGVLDGNAAGELPEAVVCQLPRVRRLERLTPGDFAVALRQVSLWDETPSPARFYEVLQRECALKREDDTSRPRIGF